MELEILLQQLGRIVSPEEIDQGFQRLDMDASGLIDFNEFYSWYKSTLAKGSIREE
jgi:Ca2+-binding EF-hand superfamily protein